MPHRDVELDSFDQLANDMESLQRQEEELLLLRDAVNARSASIESCMAQGRMFINSGGGAGTANAAGTNNDDEDGGGSAGDNFNLVASNVKTRVVSLEEEWVKINGRINILLKRIEENAPAFRSFQQVIIYILNETRLYIRQH